MKSKTTERYAKTFFKISLEKDQLENIIRDMKGISKIFKLTPSIRGFITNPLVTQELVQTLFFSKIEHCVNSLTLEFFNFLIKKNRIQLIPDIPGSFIDQYENYKNIIRATIKSVHKLSADQIEKIKAQLKKTTGGEDIRIKNLVDPKLIAGIQIKIGDTVIDANIKNKLVQLKRILAA